VTDLTRLSNQAFRTHAGRLLFLGALAFMGVAHAELYKWIDGQGKVNYSDQPPTVNAQTIRAPQQAETATQAAQSLNDQDQAYQKRREEAEQAHVKSEKEAEQARIQHENCITARNNLSTLQNKPRVYTTNAAGQRTYMDDAARANALANTQKAISDFCK
jgi:23S rRNA maturation mini-RNase III